EGREGRLQLPAHPVVDDRGARHQRVPEGRRSDLPRVLHLRAWARHVERRLPLHGPRPEGPRRGRLGRDVGSASRRVSGLMDGGRLLTATGLVRPARPAGFCPACRVLMKALDARQELAKPMVAALIALAVAGVAWATMVQQSRSMAGMDGMDVGLGPIQSFAVTWVVMMAAMMLPSAIPVVLEFARAAEGRRRWPVATGVLAVTYLGVWLVFGVVCYLIYTALRMPWPHQASVVGLALALARVSAL